MTDRFRYFLPACLACFLLSGCDIINPAEDIPAYLFVEAFTLETDPETEGSNSARITEVWLTVDGQFRGAYSLPALIPVLKNGEAQVRLDAGIKENGITATPDIYPFYEPWEGLVNLTPEVIDTIKPVIGYRDNAKFAFIEAFETNGHIFQNILQGESENRIQLTEADVFEGNSSGTFFADTNHLVVEIATNQRFSDLTTVSPLVFLEVNYKSDIPVIFGIIGYDGINADGTTTFDPGFNPRDTWNKIYFNMGEIIFASGFNEHQIVLRAFIPVEGGQITRPRGQVWLDNIKLVHF